MKIYQDEVEAAFSNEVRRARTLCAISQAGLAALMERHGHGWHQTTVTKVESGERRIMLSEAVSLSELLGIALPTC